VPESERFLDHDIGFDEYVTGNGFIDLCERIGATFCKIDFVHEFSGREAPVFVTHNGDYHVNAARFALRPRGLRRWFAQNKQVSSDLVEGIPIGLENMVLQVSAASQMGRFASEIPGALEKAKRIDALHQKDLSKKRNVYANMNAMTYPDERLPLLDYLRRLPWITCTDRLPIAKYYRDLARHRFVVCPRGNGTDCHRVWEALYLKTVPIVRSSVVMNEFRDLPILFVESWEDLTERFLDERYEEMVSRRYDLGRMRMSYWAARVAEAVREAAG